MKAILHNTIIRTVVAIAVAYYTGYYDGGLFGGTAVAYTSSGPAFVSTLGLTSTEVAIANGAAAGFAGGFVASGGNIKAALTGAIAGGITGGISGYYSANYGSTYPFSRVLANGVGNGIASKIEGGKFLDGLKSGLTTSLLTYGNVQFRNIEIKNSLGNYLNDGTGLSSGVFGDSFKLAGERLSEALVAAGKIFGGPLGGTQNAPSTFFGFSYAKGGFTDLVLESFAGPHDFANSPYFYELDGTAKFIDGISGKLLDLATNMTTSLAFATPFAAAAIAEQTNYAAYRYLQK